MEDKNKENNQKLKFDICDFLIYAFEDQIFFLFHFVEGLMITSFKNHFRWNLTKMLFRNVSLCDCYCALILVTALID